MHKEAFASYLDIKKRKHLLLRYIPNTRILLDLSYYKDKPAPFLEKVHDHVQEAFKLIQADRYLYSQRTPDHFEFTEVIKVKSYKTGTMASTGPASKIFLSNSLIERFFPLRTAMSIVHENQHKRDLHRVKKKGLFADHPILNQEVLESHPWIRKGDSFQLLLFELHAYKEESVFLRSCEHLGLISIEDRQKLRSEIATFIHLAKAAEKIVRRKISPKIFVKKRHVHERNYFYTAVIDDYYHHALSRIWVYWGFND